jgi:hypothetical protein
MSIERGPKRSEPEADASNLDGGQPSSRLNALENVSTVSYPQANASSVTDRLPSAS